MKNELRILAWIAVALAGCKEQPKPGETPPATASSEIARAAPASSERASGASERGGGTEAPGEPSASAAALSHKCEKLGCKGGDGSFFEKCDCKDKQLHPPLVASYDGGYSKFLEQPEFEVENTSDRPIHWASAALYYYDKSGKQLAVDVDGKQYKHYSVNGSNFTLKPKAKQTIAFGWKGKTAPKGATKLQVVFDGWCYGTEEDKASEQCINVASAPEERAAQ